MAAPSLSHPISGFLFGYVSPPPHTKKNKNIRPLLFHCLEVLGRRAATGGAEMEWLLTHRFDPIIKFLLSYSNPQVFHTIHSFLGEKTEYKYETGSPN